MTWWPWQPRGETLVELASFAHSYHFSEVKNLKESLKQKHFASFLTSKCLSLYNYPAAQGQGFELYLAQLWQADEVLLLALVLPTTWAWELRLKAMPKLHPRQLELAASAFKGFSVFSHIDAKFDDTVSLVASHPQMAQDKLAFWPRVYLRKILGEARASNHSQDRHILFNPQGIALYRTFCKDQLQQEVHTISQMLTDVLSLYAVFSRDTTLINQALNMSSAAD
ncbi:MAG: hypothetical protein R2880_09645 [Deinococcales bacterium]